MDPIPDHFCLEVLPQLIAAGIEIPNEVTNDCDPGDKQYIGNATTLQTDTSAYVGQSLRFEKLQCIYLRR